MAKILVVDDSVTDRKLAVGFLKKAGHVCMEVSDGLDVAPQALLIQPDAILMDVMMKGQDGFATCRHLKRIPELAEVPIVLMSSTAGENDRLWGERIGAAGYVAKPFAAEDLVGAVQGAMKSKAKTPPATRSGRKRVSQKPILVVDDSPTDRTLAAGLLQKRGQPCVELDKGAEVMDRAKALDPDVILLDVMLGDEDGFALCRQLKSDPATQHIPIVMVSSRDTENDQFWGKRNGAAAYVCKPFAPEELYEAIEAARKSRDSKTNRPFRSWRIGKDTPAGDKAPQKKAPRRAQAARS